MTAAVDVTAQERTWYEATAVPHRERGALSFDLDVEVCVIGGGLAGLTTARELARRGWSVAVLDRGQIGGAASGRNAGFVLPGFAASPVSVVQRVGLARARELWALAEAGRSYVRETIAETAMPGVAPQDGWLRVAKFSEDAALAERVRLLRDDLGVAVDLWPADQVQAHLKSPFYRNAAHFRDGFHVHPLNYLQGLAAAAEQAGVRIFDSTPALSLDASGVRKRVFTPTARVRATHIVLAGNVQLGALMPRLSSTLMPITTFIAVTDPIGERLNAVIDWPGCVSDGARTDNHYRIVGGDRLLWSGGLRSWAAGPRPFASRLRADIQRTYPQLGNVSIANVWSGTLGRTVHKMPQIGELSPGLWVASGFGGHGLNTTAMAGLLIARAIAEGDPSWRLFEPYELVWAGGAIGRAVIQVGYTGVRLYERMRALFHRRPPPSSATPMQTPSPGPAAEAALSSPVSDRPEQQPAVPATVPEPATAGLSATETRPGA